MVHVDLEYRLRAGQAARVEEYLARFPALTDDRDVMLGLVAAEYEWRRRRESGLAVADFVRRFPEFDGDLPDRIAKATVAYGPRRGAHRDTPPPAVERVRSRRAARPWRHGGGVHGPADLASTGRSP